MTTLQQMYNAIGAYLAVQGNKEVTSISTCQGSEDDYILNVHDIYDGLIGANPYSGRDKISLPKNGMLEKDIVPVRKEVNSEWPLHIMDLQKRMKTVYFELEEELLKRSDEQMLAKDIYIIWGALTVMRRAGIIDINTMNALYSDFTKHKLNLE